MTNERARVLALGAIAALFARAAYLQAQVVAPCPPATGGVFLPCQVDVPPRSLPDNAIPAYPAILLATGVGGIVRVAYTIDSTGRSLLETLTVVQSSHALFTLVVRTVIPRTRYSPGVRDGQRVPVRREEVFEFIAKDKDSPPLDVVLLVVDSTAAGVPRTVIGTLPRDSSAIGALTSADLLEAERAALAVVANEARSKDAGTEIVICVEFHAGGNRGPADAETIRRLSVPGLRAVPPRDCPPTYESMFARIDSLGRVIPRPPGSVDPERLTLERSWVWTRDVVAVETVRWKGTGGVRHRCAVRRAGDMWTATCKVTGVMVS